MIIDNSLYMMKIGGRPNDGAAWSTLWDVATHYSSSIDLGITTNRSIANAGYWVWRQGAAATFTAGGSMEIALACSAAAAMGTDTVLWTSGVIAVATWAALLTINTLIYAIKVPQNIPLRYLAVRWINTTQAQTAGTADIYITPNAPYPLI